MAPSDENPFAQPNSELASFWGNEEPAKTSALPKREESRPSLVKT